eukprot:1195299-Prorocentrum_minimum.AAC.2
MKSGRGVYYIYYIYSTRGLYELRHSPAQFLRKWTPGFPGVVAPCALSPVRYPYTRRRLGWGPRGATNHNWSHPLRALQCEPYRLRALQTESLTDRALQCGPYGLGLTRKVGHTPARRRRGWRRGAARGGPSSTPGGAWACGQVWEPTPPPGPSRGAWAPTGAAPPGAAPPPSTAPPPHASPPSRSTPSQTRSCSPPTSPTPATGPCDPCGRPASGASPAAGWSRQPTPGGTCFRGNNGSADRATESDRGQSDRQRTERQNQLVHRRDSIPLGECNETKTDLEKNVRAT